MPGVYPNKVVKGIKNDALSSFSFSFSSNERLNKNSKEAFF
jgi:hypothetical protein